MADNPVQNNGQAPDRFDPVNVRINPSLALGAGVKKSLVVLPVRKPNKSEWVRVHPDEEYHLHTAVLEIKGEGKSAEEVYLVPAHLQPELALDPCFRLCVLALAVSRHGDYFLKRVNLPREGDRSNTWTDSALAALKTATKTWTRVGANMRAGMYDVFEATVPIPDPSWPTMAPPELLRAAFANKYIDSMAHPAVQQLLTGGSAT
jgi:hypothetical protein